MARRLRVYDGGGVRFLGCLWPIILFVPILDLTQGPPWWHLHLPAKMDSSVRVPGRLAGHIVLLIRTFCYETTHASGYYRAWPG